MSKHILIVDDEDILRTTLKHYFEDCGYITKEAANGKEALEILADNNIFDCALVDIRMPVMRGDEFIIKASVKYPQLKFIIQTGTVKYVLDDNLIKAGLTNENILYKPVLKLNTYTDLIEKLTKTNN